jgi:hypothetical protein
MILESKFCYRPAQIHQSELLLLRYSHGALDHSFFFGKETGSLCKQHRENKQNLQHFVQARCIGLRQMHWHDKLGPCKLDQCTLHLPGHLSP